MIFNLILFYFAIYYLQIGSRIPVLGTIRLEFIVGTIILYAICSKKASLLLKNNKYRNAAIFFFAALCASFCGAFATHTASSAIVMFIDILKVSAMYIMIVGAVDTEKKLIKFLWLYMLLLVWIYLEPLVLYKMGNMALSRGHLRGVTGLFAHYNSLGLIIVLALIFIVELLKFHKKIILRGILVFFLICALMALVLTSSRTAYLGLMAVGIFMVLCSRKKIRNLIIAVVVAVIVFSLSPSEYQERFLSMGKMGDVLTGQEVTDDTIGNRWQIVKDAWAIFLDYPIFGCGLNSFAQVRAKRFIRYQMSHNLYMQVLTDTGIIGFSAFAYFIFIIFTSCLCVRKKALYSVPEQRLLLMTSNIVLIILGVLLVVGIATHTLYSNHWWVMMALCFVMERIQKRKKMVISERIVQNADRAAQSSLPNIKK
jgi:putative inorganic carbon (hco3(-)) transporter